MANDSQNPDFEQLRKLLESLGLNLGESDSDLESFLAEALSGSSGFSFGMTPADADPDAAWRTTMTAAQKLLAEVGPDPAFQPGEVAAIADSERLAQSWLDSCTDFPSPARPVLALRRSDWLAATSDGWRQLVEPIIEGLAQAMQRSGEAELGELAPMLQPMLHTSASMMYREHLKHQLSDTACDVLTGTDIGVDLLGNQQVCILPTNLAAFTTDLRVGESELLLYLLSREAARTRLFAAVSWLSPQLNALLSHFAREITIDLEAIMAELNPADLNAASFEQLLSIGQRLQVSFFKPASTETQLEILDRLGVLLALIEGWVDHVTTVATKTWLANPGQLREVVSRRRASSGPAHRVFKELLGLQLSPRLVRDAENFWAALDHDRGISSRDSTWHHPDVLPTKEHLADPLSYLAANRDDEPDALDEELRQLLAEE